MADNDLNDQNNGKKAIFVAVVIVLGLLMYIMINDMHKLPPTYSLQNTSQHSQNPVVEESLPPPSTQEITVGFRVSGRIAQMFFVEHTAVKQGDILASLDKTPFEEALASAKAQLLVAQGDSSKSAHVPTSTFNAIEAARLNVETAQDTYNEAHTELEKRRGQLVAGQLDNVYSDDVQNEHDAELNLERARRALAQEEDAPGNNPDRDANKAALQAAEANVAIAETNLADTDLHAPAAGTIASRTSEVGATVPAGATVYTLSVPKTAESNP